VVGRNGELDGNEIENQFSGTCFREAYPGVWGVGGEFGLLVIFAITGF
jgi:hypothetical protein